MKLLALTVAVLLAAGCTRTIDATPIKEPPPQLDCDLIFPAPSPNT